MRNDVRVKDTCVFTKPPELSNLLFIAKGFSLLEIVFHGLNCLLCFDLRSAQGLFVLQAQLSDFVFDLDLIHLVLLLHHFEDPFALHHGGIRHLARYFIRQFDNPGAVPDPETLRRHRLTLSMGYALLKQEVNNEMMESPGGSCCWRTVDSSPMGG